MGITIHFEGRLAGEVAFHNLTNTAKEFARTRGWGIESVELEEVALQRVRGEKDWDYTGPIRGVVLYPHIDCEPVRLEFDRDFYVQSFTKTQFAGVQTHLDVVQLLRAIKPLFQNLNVEDEGEYWNKWDTRALGEHMAQCRKAIEEVFKDKLQTNPDARMNVKLPSGRIVDIIG